ncbi:unnamed protein product [Pedinophyceae sp. YPF-701]|nr:unnamed protein product [Pedinophyceae sp. YPF-701]
MLARAEGSEASKSEEKVEEGGALAQGEAAASKAEASGSSSSGADSSMDFGSMDGVPVPRTQTKKPNVLAGAVEEAKLVEWPTVGAAFNQTLLVIAIILASSGVLLGFNFVLNELSQKLFFNN